MLAAPFCLLILALAIKPMLSKRFQRFVTAGIAAEMYPDSVKFQKQMKYANDKNIPWVAIVGDQEEANETFMLKNMASGQQEALSLAEIIQKCK
jgi:histidyl-tRNA synthetase